MRKPTASQIVLGSDGPGASVANCMTILVQERPKDTDDAIHEVRHLIERFKNRLTSNNLRLSERYIKSELEVLVRLSVIGSCGPAVKHRPMTATHSP